MTESHEEYDQRTDKQNRPHDAAPSLLSSLKETQQGRKSSCGPNVTLRVLSTCTGSRIDQAVLELPANACMLRTAVTCLSWD